MKKKELLERIQYLEDKVLELRETNTHIYERLETMCNIIVLSDLNPANKKKQWYYKGEPIN